MVGAVLVENSLAGSLDSEVVRACGAGVLLCLGPAVFTWSRRAYRGAAGVLAVVLTLVAIRAALVGDVSFIPVAIVACLTLVPIRRMPSRKGSGAGLSAEA
jgi:hypothetical protein